jgi:hypothetical protein
MLQVFHLDVAKGDLDIAYTCKLQAYVSSVLGVSYLCCKCFHLDVAYVYNSHIRVFKFFLVFCRCFRCMLQMFQLFWTYVAGALSGCYKNRSGVAHVAMEPTYHNHMLQLLGDVRVVQAHCWGTAE